MKKITALFLITSLIFCVSQQIKSQAYQPLLEDNKSWDVLQWCGCECNPICCYGWGRRFVINGDTAINNKTYKKVYRYNILRDSTVPQVFYCPSYLVDTILWPTTAYLREDTILKKVYYYDTDEMFSDYYADCMVDNEVVLYDFNLSVGDTVKCTVATWDNCSFNAVVTSVYYVSINGINRKVFDFYSGAGQDYYIEGIGGTESGGGLYQSVFFFESGYQLECVQKDGLSLFNYYCRNFISNITDVKNETKYINVNYNSSNRIITANNITENENIILYNSLGVELINIKPVTNEVKINACNIKNGCYILKSAKFYKKIIIY